MTYLRSTVDLQNGHILAAGRIRSAQCGQGIRPSVVARVIPSLTCFGPRPAILSKPLSSKTAKPIMRQKMINPATAFPPWTACATATAAELLSISLYPGRASRGDGWRAATTLVGAFTCVHRQAERRLLMLTLRYSARTAAQTFNPFR